MFKDLVARLSRQIVDSQCQFASACMGIMTGSYMDDDLEEGQQGATGRRHPISLSMLKVQGTVSAQRITAPHQ